jgi:thioredoxin:protein disulfide reductase
MAMSLRMISIVSRSFRVLLLIIMAVMPGVGSLNGESLSPRAPFGALEFLPVDEAFLLTVAREGDSLQLHWLVQPGYYLYKDRLSFNFPEKPVLPDGQEKWDEIFGDVEVYYTELSVSMIIPSSFLEDKQKIVIGYQGCADAGLCYPPQEREFEVDKI